MYTHLCDTRTGLFVVGELLMGSCPGTAIVSNSSHEDAKMGNIKTY